MNEKIDSKWLSLATTSILGQPPSARVRRLPQQILESALYKLDVLNAAQKVDDLRSPPGNRLEALTGKLSGLHSIRINSQWRIVFRWEASNAYDVQVIDYH